LRSKVSLLSKHSIKHTADRVQIRQQTISLAARGIYSYIQVLLVTLLYGAQPAIVPNFPMEFATHLQQRM